MFINDVKLAQVPAKSQVTSGTFFYDWHGKKISIGQNPSGNKVELSRRTQALMLNKGSYSIKGIGFKRYASGGSGGGNWTISSTVFANEPSYLNVENSVFVDNSYIGLGISKPQSNSSKITNSIFANNGYAGVHGNGSRAENANNPSIRNDLLVEGNVFNANNDQQFDIKCSAACGAANVKLNNMVGFTAKNNVVENAGPGAYGLWCDVHCIDTVLVNNLVQNNAKVGIFYEISRDAIIANNLVIDNGHDGIAVTSARVKVYNNTVLFDRAEDSKARGIHIFDDSRCSSCQNDAGIGPDTAGIELVNNIVVAKNGGELSVSIGNKQAGGTNTSASQFYDKFNYNAYHRTAPNAAFYVWRYDNGTVDYGIRSTVDFNSITGWDANSLDLSGSDDPFFVDKNNGDYRVRQNSQAYNTGHALPSDVAQAIGFEAGQPISRGAISWPDF